MKLLHSMELCAVALMTSCATGPVSPHASHVKEDIYILRSIREPATSDGRWCTSTRAGFEPMPADAERTFSFWSLQSRPEDGKVIDAHAERVAELRACFGATDQPARQNFYAEIKLHAATLVGRGECAAFAVNFPESGLFPVRCQLWLTGAPPYVGGLLTTNTMTSKAALGGASDPAGYTQASIATIRLWLEK